jgi:hypothetical protein
MTNATSIGNAELSVPGNGISWHKLLDMYPGQFRARLSQLRLDTPTGGEIIAHISLDPLDDSKMILVIDQDTIPGNTIINGRGTIDAIINPETFRPVNPTVGVRYLILEGINQASEYGQVGYSGPVAWKNADQSDFRASANDIIEWTGNTWTIIFDSTVDQPVTYITNSYTGIQYKWEDGSWSKSYEGIYGQMNWRLVL